jgi:hypothetical protein
VANAWFLEFEHLYKLSKSFPVVATPLTPTIQRFQKNQLPLVKEVIQTLVVPSNVIAFIRRAVHGV